MVMNKENCFGQQQKEHLHLISVASTCTHVCRYCYLQNRRLELKNAETIFQKQTAFGMQEKDLESGDLNVCIHIIHVHPKQSTSYKWISVVTF